MDYEKTYKNDLSRARVAYKDEDRHLKATLERIFPELKENKIAYGYFPNEFSSYEDYIKYLKEKGFAFEVPERKYKKEQQ